MISRQRGNASFALFVVLFFAATLFFFILFLKRSADGGPRHAPAATTRDARLDKLEGEIYQLYTALDGAESLRSGSKYLEIVSAMEEKWNEADELWDQKTRGKKGLADGLMGGFNENYESRFSREDKFRMLSEKFGVPVEKIRALKADLEIMFTDELAEKFAPQPAETDPAAQGEGADPTSDPPSATE